MRTGRNYEDVCTQALKDHEKKRDYMAKSGQLAMADDAKSISLDNGTDALTLGITENCHRQLAITAGIPQSYYEKLRDEDPELLAYNFNRRVTTRGGDAYHLARTLNGRLRGVLSTSYRIIDNSVGISGVESILNAFPDAEVKSCDLDPNGDLFTAKIVLWNTMAEVKPGDFVRCGMMVRNSETGMGRYMIVFFCERLVCSNGMTITLSGEGIRKVHRGKRLEFMSGANLTDYLLASNADDEAIKDATVETARRIAEKTTFMSYVDLMKDSAARPVTGDPEKLVEAVGRRFGLTRFDQRTVLANLLEDGDMTQWGLANAVTRRAHDTWVDSADFSRGQLAYNDSTQLEKTGGDIVLISEREWQRMNAAAA